MILIIDPDASKVIDAVRSTGVVITRPMIEYAHYIISNMKAIGTWQLSNAVYGFVGGTADSHKWNWKDLRDVDTAFRMTFTNMSHSSNGIQGNSTDAFADTKVNGITDIPLNTNFMGMYNSNASLSPITAIMGYNDTGVQLSVGLSNSNLGANHTGNAANAGNVVNNLKGFRLNYRVSNTQFKHLVNGSIYPFTSTAITRGDFTITIGALNGHFKIAFNNAIVPFAIIGNQVLTDTQALQQSQIVTNAQLILNRA